MICAAIGPASPDLRELAERYFSVRLICASGDTLENYRLAVKHWCQVNGDLPVDRVNEEAIARFQQHLAAGRSPASVNCYTRPIKAILRFGVEQGLLAAVPKIRRIPERKRSPLAFTIDEFSKVLACVRELKGTEGGYPESAWWTAVLLTAWESGLRYTALFKVRSVDLLWDSHGFFSAAEFAKDREADWFPLQAGTMAAIRAIYDPIREFLFPRTHAIPTIGKRFRAILDKSGVYAPKGSGMRFHRLRRSKASYTELAGGDAQRALGHSARSVTERYLDPRIVGRVKQPPMPMPL